MVPYHGGAYLGSSLLIRTSPSELRSRVGLASRFAARLWKTASRPPDRIAELTKILKSGRLPVVFDNTGNLTKLADPDTPYIRVTADLIDKHSA